MARELIYTSAPRGLRDGSSGFCVVAYTRGMPANLVQLLESLSGYKPFFPHYDKNAFNNPVSHSHYKTTIGPTQIHILSRICFAGLDYSKRSNKLAHHLVFETQEKIQCGPAVVFRVENLFLSKWEAEPAIIEQQKKLCEYEWPLRRAATWEAATGDAGWAAVLADSFVKAPEKTAFIIFDPNNNVDTLSLVDEALLLLRPEQRWQVSFNTYFTSLPPSVQCNWRFCVPDSDALKEARRQPGTLIIDMTKPMEKAPDGILAERARTGIEKISKPLSSFTDKKLTDEEINLDEPSKKQTPMPPKLNIQMPQGANRKKLERLTAPSKEESATNDNKLTQKQKIILATIILVAMAIVLFFLNVNSLGNKTDGQKQEKPKSNIPSPEKEKNLPVVATVTDKIPAIASASPPSEKNKTQVKTSTSAQTPAKDKTPPPTDTNSMQGAKQPTVANPEVAGENNTEKLRLSFWKKFPEAIRKKKDEENEKNKKPPASLTNKQNTQSAPLKIIIPLALSESVKIEIILKPQAKITQIKNNNTDKVTGQLSTYTGLEIKYEDVFKFMVRDGGLLIERIKVGGNLEQQFEQLTKFTGEVERYVINDKSYCPDFTPGDSGELETGSGSFTINKDGTLQMTYRLKDDDKLAKLSTINNLDWKNEDFEFKLPKDEHGNIQRVATSNDLKETKAKEYETKKQLDALKNELKTKCNIKIKQIKDGFGGENGWFLLNQHREENYEKLIETYEKILEEETNSSKSYDFKNDDINALWKYIEPYIKDICQLKKTIKELKKRKPQEDDKIKTINEAITGLKAQECKNEKINNIRKKFQKQIEEIKKLERIRQVSEAKDGEMDTIIKKITAEKDEEMDPIIKKIIAKKGEHEIAKNNKKTAMEKLNNIPEIPVQINIKKTSKAGIEGIFPVKKIIFLKEPTK